jgi:TonB-linked SusC/RagA family outer membrane protein
MSRFVKHKCGFSAAAIFLIMMLYVFPVVAQQITVRGIVCDHRNDPLTGAIVVSKGTAVNTVTDIDGKFTLNVDANAILTVTYLGFKSQEIKVNGPAFITFVMTEETVLLEDVVVVGYGTVRRKDLTGAVSSVGETVLNDRPSSNLGQALQGRIAGVYIVDNGNPQGNVALKIRGLGTIGNSDPLYVIDGVPSSLGLNSLNNEDIASIDVLKDASATAIYGSQGANGVVIITTKRGHGDGTINLKVNYGIAESTHMPKFLNATQYAALNNQMLSEAGLGTNPDWANPELLGNGTDWVDAMFRTATLRNYTLSYSGGNDQSNYYFSGGYTDQDGIIESVGFQRITLQFNGDYKVKPWVKFGNNLTFSTDNKTNGSYGLSDVFRSLPTQRIYDDDGNFDGPSGNNLWHGTIRNQYGTTVLNKNKTNGYNFLGNVYAEFSLLNGLKFKSVGGAQLVFVRNTNFTPKYPWKPTEVPVSSLYKGSSSSFTYLWDNYLTYEKTLGDHTLNAMGGMSLQWGMSDWFNGEAKGFLKDDIHQVDNAEEISNFKGSGSEWAIASFMLRANYAYKDRYLLTATVRQDGSSRFGPKHRWGTFPSFSAAWRLSEEDFYNKDGFVSDVKIRAGYGVTGHQNIGNYSYASSYDTGIYTFNGKVVSTLVASRMPNPYVHWEEVHQTNIGADIGILKNRIRLSFDLYDKNTKDMLVGMSVPVSSGYNDQAVPMINAGKVNNKGIEFTISAAIFDRHDFSWTADFNAAFNKNKIVSLNSGVPDYYGSIEMAGNTRIHADGHPIGSFYGYVADGIFQTQQEVDNWAVQIVGTNSTNGTAPGDIRFLDLDNSGVIDENDRTFIGNPAPNCTFALNNTLVYKNIDVSIFLQGIYGNDIFNANRIYMESMSSAQNQMATTLARWQGEGTSNTMPRAVHLDPNSNTRSSSRFIEDGSYLRLKDLTLGYTLPKTVAKKIAMDHLRIYASCKNLFTITNYTGFDPEVGMDGFDLGHYPVTRTFNIGVDIKF